MKPFRQFLNESSDEQRILEIVRRHEATMLDPSQPILQTLMNPFRRLGVTVQDIAVGMDWFSDKVLASGRRRVDLPRTRKVLKAMLASGKLVQLGRARTLAAGSSTKEMYATPEFQDMIDMKMKEIKGKALGEEQQTLGEAWPRRGQEDFLLVYFIGDRKGRQKFLSRARADKEFEACKRDPQVSKVILYGGKPGRLVDEPLASWSRGDKS